MVRIIEEAAVFVSERQGAADQKITKMKDGIKMGKLV